MAEAAWVVEVAWVEVAILLVWDVAQEEILEEAGDTEEEVMIM